MADREVSEERWRAPRATYRLQFNGDYTFADARHIVPYLEALGISHCYASPFLKARAGSCHGYDIVDHNALNPEIGSRADFEAFTDALGGRDMGLVVDMVPNHMGVGGDDNGWWLDVLENGPASPHAIFFDIDWRPMKEQLRGKVLLPVLGDHYGAVLEQGELRLVFDIERGEFSIRYYENRFPIDPGTYPLILQHQQERLLQALGPEDTALLEFQSLTTAFGHLPGRDELTEEKMEERRRDKEIHKRHLAELCARFPPIGRFIRSVVRALNGEDANHSFDALNELLERQAYRLAYWQVAADEINYRRFFDINDLAGLRMEQPLVFHTTHQLIFELISQGRLQGLRIDHPDGLYDPLGYYRRLQHEVGELLPGVQVDNRRVSPCYLVVEKILASYEHLPEEWPVDGTTGYEFSSLVNGLFVQPAAETELDRFYTRFVGRRIDFDDLLYERKRLIIEVQLSSELTVLANLLDAIAQTDRRTRDFTLNGCRSALFVLTACFPVYRTYITSEQVSEQDRRYVEWAVAQAKKRSPAADISIFDFIRDILLEGQQLSDPGRRRQAIRFTLKFQQYTAPVMAKALEDTAFYIYNRLVSLNEVGGDPRRFGYSIAAFHRANQERLRRWPHSMLCTATHDSKRCEDVRARLNVLSEIPGEWQNHVARWSRVNRTKKVVVDGVLSPARNDEYLLYQTLFGTWPLEETDEKSRAAYRERIRAYMLKAVKEAKVYSSWINPNTAYEQAVSQMIDRLLGDGPNPFLSDFIPFQRRFVRYGLLNSLAQTLLKLTSPGVPDLYQGTELWNLSLVDPDNRRQVDYAVRRRYLDGIVETLQHGESRAATARALIDTLEDGRAKLYLIWRVLNFRRSHRELFDAGEYLPLTCEGERSDHLCAFARRCGSTSAIVVAPRWFVALVPQEGGGLPYFSPDTVIELPANGGRGFENLFTGESVGAELAQGRALLPAAALFNHFPVALLASS